MSGIYVRAGVGDEQYALAVEEVLEVTEIGQLMPVPGAPSEVLGVRNLRGQVIPVVDLGALFGIGGETSERERVIVVETHDGRLGLAVDAIVNVGEVKEPVEPADSERLAGAALIDGALVGIIDLDALLADLAPAVSA